jgi:hypothetical protein
VEGSWVVEVVVEGSGLAVRESGGGVVVREEGVEGVSSSESESEDLGSWSSGSVP